MTHTLTKTPGVCTCPAEASTCSLYPGVRMTARRKEICAEKFSARPLPPAACSVYRARWAKGVDPLPRPLPGESITITDVPAHMCPHRGPAVDTAEAPACCGGGVQPVHECHHPVRAGDRVTIAGDCKRCEFRPRPVSSAPIKLRLNCPYPPGDVLSLTAAVHDLHRQHPGRYLTGLGTMTQRTLWNYNPDISQFDTNEPDVRDLTLAFPGDNQRCQPFLDLHQWLSRELGVPLRVESHRPYVYLSRDELRLEPPAESPLPLWVINAGTKDDFTVKWWGTANYQAVVNALYGRVQFVQVGEGGHNHPPLLGVINLVGMTPTRKLIRLVHHAAGGLGPTSFLAHLCAALERPYMQVMGGREPTGWTAYPTSHQLHTIGALDCCRSGGCWRARTVKLNDGKPADESLCLRPVKDQAGADVPECMRRITPAEVVATIEKLLPVQAPALAKVS